jgi:hypothetical protein
MARWTHLANDASWTRFKVSSKTGHWSETDGSSRDPRFASVVGFRGAAIGYGVYSHLNHYLRGWILLNGKHRFLYPNWPRPCISCLGHFARCLFSCWPFRLSTGRSPMSRPLMHLDRISIWPLTPRRIRLILQVGPYLQLFQAGILVVLTTRIIPGASAI